MGQRRATLHRGDEDRSFPCFSNCLFSSRRPGSQSGDANRRIIASLANGMATRYRHHARTASCHLHRRRLGRRHLFRRGSSPARSRHPACHFRQRFLHHGNLSASESHRALRPADEGHRWKYLCAWLRRRHGIRKTRRSHHPLDHGRIHAELPQRQPTILHAHSLRYELRRVIFPPCHPRQRRRQPTVSLLLSTVVGVLFVLISFLSANAFERVIAMLSFFFVANYTLSYFSLFALRKREPHMDRPYRAWGYPWTTGIALAASVLFLIGSIVTDQKNAPLALGMLVLSYPVFRVLKWASRETGNKSV